MAAAKEPGVVRLGWRDPQKQSLIVLWESRTEPMSDQETDITKQPIMPLYGKVFNEDDYLVLHVTSDATDGLDASDSKVRVPVTFYNTRTGAEFDATLGYAGVYKFTFVADATTFTAATEKEWGYFQIPAGLKAKLGQKNPFNSRVLISPYDDTA